MKTLKKILLCTFIFALLCENCLYLISSGIELDNVFTMAPYMLTGDCCRYIDFMGTSIMTVAYVAIIIAVMCMTLILSGISVYNIFQNKIRTSVICAMIPFVTGLILSVLQTVLA